jgi:hypothetical protein
MIFIRKIFFGIICIVVELILIQPQFLLAKNAIETSDEPYISYFGGRDEDQITVCGILKNGNKMIAGYTMSDDLPVTPNCHQSKFNYGGVTYTGFLACFDTLGSLVWCTYFGKDGYTRINSGLIDSEGNIVIVGETSADSLGTINGISHLGSKLSFLAKFSPQGEQILFTYLPGRITSVAKDNNDTYYLSGWYGSRFELKAFGFHDSVTMNGGQDIFCTIVRENGQIVRSFPIIGNKSEGNPRLTNVVGANLYLSFQTNSDTIFGIRSLNDLPTSVGQSSYFLVQLDTTGEAFWGRYMGNNSSIFFNGFVEYEEGVLFSYGGPDTNNFISPNAPILSYSEITRSVLTSIDLKGAVNWATYTPTAFGNYSGNGIFRDSVGLIYQIGIEGEFGYLNYGDTLVRHNAFQKHFGGGESDIIFYVYEPNGKLIYGTFIGGNARDLFSWGKGLIFHGKRLFFAGCSKSDSTFTTSNAFQKRNNGLEDGLIASFNLPVFFPDIYYNTLQYENSNCKGSGSGSIKIKGSQPEGGNGIYTYSWIEANSLVGPYFLLAQSGKDYILTSPIISKWYKRVVTSGSKIDTSEALFIGNVNKGSIGFKVNKLIQCQKGNNFEFEDTTINATSHLWNFDDGTFSAERKVSKTYDYSTKNYYQVKLINWNNGNCYDTLVKTIYLISNPELPSINGNAIVVRGETTKYAIDKKWNDKIEWQLKLGEGFIRNDTLIVRWLKSGLDTLLIYVTNAGGCPSDTLFFPVQVGSAIGKEDFKLGNELKLYPNPATSIVSLQLTGLAANAPMEVALYNVLGQAVIQDQTRYNGQHYELNLQDLNPGVYIVKLQAGGKVYTKNFVKD